MKRSERGFTVIEMIFVIALLAGATVLFFVQKHNLEVAARDDKRKTAVSAIYYDLEEVFYPKNGYYPLELTTKALTAMDEGLLTDTNGVKIDEKLDTSGLDSETKQALESGNTKLSEYQYEPANCDNDGKCKSYTLRVSLENEAEFVKQSRHK